MVWWRILCHPRPPRIHLVFGIPLLSKCIFCTPIFFSFEVEVGGQWVIFAFPSPSFAIFLAVLHSPPLCWLWKVKTDEGTFYFLFWGVGGFPVSFSVSGSSAFFSPIRVFLRFSALYFFFSFSLCSLCCAGRALCKLCV
ncbi:hypothetical protein DFJ73DRAFT_807515 [Zopfochytrium polystomum]|nr:hypothetical protein DFJ73DRAFT_807515 [Zopfochytrium polystomum]